MSCCVWLLRCNRVFWAFAVPSSCGPSLLAGGRNPTFTVVWLVVPGCKSYCKHKSLEHIWLKCVTLNIYSCLSLFVFAFQSFSISLKGISARPTPKRQEEMRSAIGEQARSDDFSETFFLQEAKILAGGVASRWDIHLSRFIILTYYSVFLISYIAVCSTLYRARLLNSLFHAERCPIWISLLRMFMIKGRLSVIMMIFWSCNSEEDWWHTKSNVAKIICVYDQQVHCIIIKAGRCWSFSECDPDISFAQPCPHQSHVWSFETAETWCRLLSLPDAYKYIQVGGYFGREETAESRENRFWSSGKNTHQSQRFQQNLISTCWIFTGETFRDLEIIWSSCKLKPPGWVPAQNVLTCESQTNTQLSEAIFDIWAWRLLSLVAVAPGTVCKTFSMAVVFSRIDVLESTALECSLSGRLRFFFPMFFFLFRRDFTRCSRWFGGWRSEVHSLARIHHWSDAVFEQQAMFLWDFFRTIWACETVNLKRHRKHWGISFGIQSFSLIKHIRFPNFLVPTDPRWKGPKCTG